jgi:hypothetical protein
VAIVSARASATTSAVWLPGKPTSITNRLVRSTRVATVPDLVPKIRSPSQCPGTARSLASAGRWEMWMVPRSRPWPFITDSPRGRRRARPLRR